MTLKEIAKEAGVSISTVSRVINKNGTSAASKEVQDKIWEIVRRTGYIPNSNARDLKTGAVEGQEPLSVPSPASLPEPRIPNQTCFFQRWRAASNRRHSGTTIF